MPKHFQPQPDKQYLIDDLNDWVRYAGGKIEYDTAMTIKEIELLYHAFEQVRRTAKTA